MLRHSTHTIQDHNGESQQKDKNDNASHDDEYSPQR